MKKFEFNKLIRNKLIDRMFNEGITVNSKTLTKEEYILKLKYKLLEEVEEVNSASSKDDITIELADVLEVMHAIAYINEIPFGNIEEARLKKQEINGSFDSYSYVNYIEVAEDNNKVIDYLLSNHRPYKLI